jgi:hypothetical protein
MKNHFYITKALMDETNLREEFDIFRASHEDDLTNMVAIINTQLCDLLISLSEVLDSATIISSAHSVTQSFYSDPNQTTWLDLIQKSTPEGIQEFLSKKDSSIFTEYLIYPFVNWGMSDFPSWDPEIQECTWCHIQSIYGNVLAYNDIPPVLKELTKGIDVSGKTDIQTIVPQVLTMFSDPDRMKELMKPETVQSLMDTFQKLSGGMGFPPPS